jgi:protein gp37
VAWGPSEPRRRTSAGNWAQPLRWEAQHEAFFAEHGRRRRVFCASLADVFDNAAPNEWRAELWMLIQRTAHLDWLLLTKRVGNAARMVDELQALLGRFGVTKVPAWPANVQLGATVANQAEVDRDVPKLLATPAAGRFLSVEPMLGPISFDGLFAHPSNAADGTNALEALDWVICGGESGPQARPMRAAWAQSLRDQCAAAGVPFLFKQWGEYLGEKQDGDLSRNPVELNATDEPVRVGKKAAGRTLDGVEHNGFPRPV